MNVIGYMLSAIAYFFFLGTQALFAPILFPIPSLLCIGALGAAWLAARKDQRVWRRRSLWFLLPFAVPILILAYGVAFKYDGAIGTAPEWRGRVLDYLVWSEVPIAVLLLVIVRVNPLVVLGISVFAWGLSCCTAFMSYMSVTNVWL